MKRDVARFIAYDFMKHIEHFCLRMEMAGEIRRDLEEVDIITLVVLPKDQNILIRHLLEGHLMKKWEATIRSSKYFILKFKEAKFEIYFATEESWGAQLLWRTGGKEYIEELCRAALSLNCQLKPEGLFNDKSERIAGETETGIHMILEEAYQPPEERWD